MTGEEKDKLNELSKKMGIELKIDKELSQIAGKPMINLIEMHRALQVPEGKSIRQVLKENYNSELIEELKKFLFVEPEKHE